MDSLDRLVQRRDHDVTGLMNDLREAGLTFQPIAAVDGPRVRVNGRWILNFASSHYLGLGQHPRVTSAAATASDPAISLSMPRVLGVTSLALEVEAEIARLVGQQRALVFPSTTHIALDVLPLLAGQSGTILFDDAAYPISIDGALLARQRGASVHRFPHNDIDTLEQMLENPPGPGRSVIVCDGVYAFDGRMARLDAMARLARRFGAMVYVDDAHGIGVLGRSPTVDMPYGVGGGGTPARLGVPPGRVIHVGGLAKAFGVPVAFVAGPARFIDELETRASGFVHSSPPSTPMLAAALEATRVHQVEGEERRRHLLAMILRFRQGVRAAGLVPGSPTLFPIQTLRFPTNEAAVAVATMLRRRGLLPVLQLVQSNESTGAAVRFVITALHHAGDIDEAVEAMASDEGVVRMLRGSCHTPTRRPARSSQRGNRLPGARHRVRA